VLRKKRREKEMSRTKERERDADPPTNEKKRNKGKQGKNRKYTCDIVTKSFKKRNEKNEDRKCTQNSWACLSLKQRKERSRTGTSRRGTLAGENYGVGASQPGAAISSIGSR